MMQKNLKTSDIVLAILGIAIVLTSIIISAFDKRPNILILLSLAAIAGCICFFYALIPWYKDLEQQDEGKKDDKFP
ncbi:hypothetical protein A3K72_01625 [Candidatus Woesearchaeota archaeon RBG_13_36_6]|nr:MAG: hypothetical protein A3K72_01625 [Candidatus Woesearchaeota archaeon RBG_13_36_6]